MMLRGDSLILRPWPALTGRQRMLVVAAYLAMLLPLMVGFSVGIAYGWALKVRSVVQIAADAAVSTAVLKLGEGPNAVRGALRMALDENLPGQLRGIAFDMAIAAGTIELRIPTAVASGLIGKEHFHFNITSSAAASGYGPR